LAAPGIPRMIASLTGTQATIFMLHRFAVPELSIAGHPPAIVRAILAELRRQRFEPVSLHDLFRKLRDGEPLGRAVAFTIDDGYFDHARVGAPIFAEFDIPATIFAVSGFLDGKTWLWWDQIAYAFTRTRRVKLKARLAGVEIEYTLDSVQARRSGASDLSERCQDASQAECLACLAALCREADVELPAAPPPEFAPMTWDEARALEKRGISLGPHTVTHPVLSTLAAEDSAAEIGESWDRLRAELGRPTPVFCYPHGRKRDFGEREMAEVHRLGLLGGVSGYFGELRPSRYRLPPEICRVPRCGFQNDAVAVLQCVSGLETVKARLRGRL
jgi:peptidoglycan/xylan/chitin deacetylase (PgdA/CDA1 family)